MTELIDAVVSWRLFLALILIYGLMPGVVLRLLVLIYSQDDPRRKELVAELYTIPRIERPLWVAEQLETVLFDGLPSRISAWRRNRASRRQRRAIVIESRRAFETIGRAAELEQLLALVPDPPQAAAVVVSAIDGMAGVGKTALAVYAAHRMVDKFPDGQLFIDLHGYTQGLAPIEPAEALEHLLRDLGIPGMQIPTSLDQRAALYRTRLADQRMLIVLDNAATEAQVAPLLPGTPGCLVLVTSRRRLAGLDHTHTHTLSLDTLPVPDAITLLVQTAGEGRLADQPPELLVELVERCGRLPLAIQIAAARLRSHPARHLADLVERLRDQQHRLGEPVLAAIDLEHGGVTDLDCVSGVGRPARWWSGGALVCGVSLGCSVCRGEFGDGAAGAGLIDDGLAVGVGGEQAV